MYIVRSFLILLTVLALCSSGWAQGGGSGCYICQTATDNSCDTWGRDCSTVTFTAPCNAAVTLYCDIISCSGDCEDCRVNAKLSKTNSVVLAQCSTNNEEDCTPAPDFDCDETGSGATLQQGTSYTIEVCLMPCFFHTCNDCSGCTARAWVRTAELPYTCP